MAHRYKHKFIIIMCVGVIALNTIYPLIYVTNMLQMTQDFVQVSFQIYDSVDESTSSNQSEITSTIARAPNETDNGTAPKFISTQRHNLTSITKILGFSNDAYKELAVRWYHEMSSLGYTHIYVIAADDEAANYFAQQKIQYDYLNPTKKGWIWGKDTCPNNTHNMKEGKIAQTYRRSIFGARWNYVLRQLQQGYHVFITDVDNLFQGYKPMHQFENDKYDMVHAFSGDINAFPMNIYRVQGFNICGGLSWIRSTPSAIDFVSELARRCRCKESIGCECHCDDQVAINNMYYKGEYNGTWNKKPHQKIVATRTDEIYWDGFDGICQKTGHTMRILDRNVAWRGSVHDEMICPRNNWIAMPQGMKDRNATRELWERYCKNDTNSTNTINLSPY